MSESVVAPPPTIRPSVKPSKGATRTPDALEKARGEFAKLLRVRITERECELAALRAQLASVGGSPAARKTQVCSSCGKAGHTKRTCAEARSVTR